MASFCYRAEIRASLERINKKNSHLEPIVPGLYVTFDDARFKIKGPASHPDTWVLTRTVGNLRRARTMEIIRTSGEIREALGQHKVQTSFDARGEFR